MLLLIDNYDSFTYNLCDYLQQLGQECKLIRNDEYTVDELRYLPLKGIVISPGPKTPKDAGITLNVINCFYKNLPIMGICLGHQAIGEYFGGELIKAGCPMHGKTSVMKHGGHPLFKGIPERFEAMRYHSLIINLPEHSELKILALSDKNEIMAIKHERYPVYGVQFHPESILTDNGLLLLKNWLEINKIGSDIPAYK